MFFGKNREQRQEQARRNMLNFFQSQVSEAQASSDPAERLLKLEDIKTAIEQTDRELREQITTDAAAKGNRMFMGTLGGGTVMGVLAFAGLHFPPLFIIAGPALGYFYGQMAGQQVANSAQENALTINKPFLDALETQKKAIVSVTDEIERNSLRDIAASPRYEEVLTKVPRLREKFAAAFGKQVAAEKSQAPQQKPPQDGFRL